MTSEDIGATALEVIPNRNNIVETSASACADKILGAGTGQCAETSARDEISDINDTRRQGETTA